MQQLLTLYNCGEFVLQIKFGNNSRLNQIYFLQSFLKMKSIFRIYAKTSKGNDNHLLNELRAMNLKPKYDQHLNSFYFNSNFNDLFDICFRCMTVQQMYVQIGQKFRLIDQQQIRFELQRLPFKNYIPIQRGIVQNTTLKILIRQSAHIPSQNVLINLITTNLNKQVVKKQYYKQILQSNQQQDLFQVETQQKQLIFKKQRKNHQSFFEIKDIVEKKWSQEDQLQQQESKSKILQLEKELSNLRLQQKQYLGSYQKISGGKLQNQAVKITEQMNAKALVIPQTENYQIQIKKIERELRQIKNFDKQNYLSEQLVYHPHLIFYIRKNKGRLLLKINKEDLYKHGWKNSVNWGPIRQSIAASVLHQSKILSSEAQMKYKIKIWDPMCGSGTLPLVAATILDEVPIRGNISKLFEWRNWPIYKQKYLKEYWTQKQRQKKQRRLEYQLLLSDKDRQTINYSIDNFRLLLEGAKQYCQTMQKTESEEQLFPQRTISSQVLQLVQNKMGFACGDFQDVIKILTPKNKQTGSDGFTNLNIITNLPYIYGRSAQKHPLNQLLSIYRRFSRMIRQYQNFIDNVFVIIDANVKDRNHFVNISSEKWTFISQYTSGGTQIRLYAWNQNKIKPSFQQSNQLMQINKLQLTSEQRQIVLKKEKSVQRALIQYRKKLSQIDRKYYRLPKHLTKDLKGWKRIIQKRRKRHLQSAYELFAKRRDKLIALKQYARLKLQLKMLKRGTVWKNKNLKLFNNNESKLQQYSQQIKQVFQKKIEEALKRQQQFLQKRKIKEGDKVQIAKIRNKWNNDEKNMVKQIKNSKASKDRNRKVQTPVKKR